MYTKDEMLRLRKMIENAQFYRPYGRYEFYSILYWDHENHHFQVLNESTGEHSEIFYSEVEPRDRFFKVVPLFVDEVDIEPAEMTESIDDSKLLDAVERILELEPTFIHDVEYFNAEHVRSVISAAFES